ncbi:MAG: hypothetical protein U0236_13730 [Nitrospira sp.]
MKATRPSLSGFRIAVLTWASLWMLAVPLFHVHPDADHLHGQVGHLHGGTIHTVMSPDLECEVKHHQSVAADSHDTGTTVAGAGHRHIEIGFSLLTDSDRKSFNPFLSQAHALVSAVALNLEPSVSQEPSSIALLSSRRLIHDLPFRGPPTLLA